MSAVSFRSPTYPLLTSAEWEEKIQTSGLFPGDPRVRLERVYDTGYSVVSSELLDELVKFIDGSSVFEVGAGSGYLARLLADRGISVRAIDHQEGPNTREEWWSRQLYFDVEKIDQSVFEEFPAEIVLMAWPCLYSNFSLEVAQKLKRGQILLYHGESQGGCTATPKFFEYLRNGPFHQLRTDDMDDAGVSEVLMQDHWNAYIKR